MKYLILFRDGAGRENLNHGTITELLDSAVIELIMRIGPCKIISNQDFRSWKIYPNWDYEPEIFDRVLKFDKHE